MISGVWGNPNFDEGNNTREQYLSKIDAFYEAAVQSIYSDAEEEMDIDQEDPFFAAMKRPQLLIDKESVTGVT